MRNIKKFESFSDLNEDFIIVKIIENFTEGKVSELLDLEIEEWIEEGNKKDIYNNYNTGECQEIVAERLLDWYEQEHSQQLTELERDYLVSRLITRYDCLKWN